MARRVCAMAALTLILAAVRAQAADTVINIRVSFKAVVNPLDGSLPMLSGREVRQSDVDALVDGMNDLLVLYGRGYRVARHGGLIAVGEIGGSFSGPSQWFNVDFFDDPDAKHDMDKAARGNPVSYAWSPNAVNIYIVDDFGGAKCSTSDSEEIIVASVGRVNEPRVILHEIGHYFSLCHTQGCSCADCDGELGTACESPGDDEVGDTLLDVQCWTLDDIANASFFEPFNTLPVELKNRVIDTAENLMSYHHMPPLQLMLGRLTEGQLDRWTNTIKALPFGFTYRAHVVDGLTYVVPDDWTLGDARGRAGANDIILLRPGTRHFIATVTLDEPTTYRVTRDGPAVFQVP